tara:strand:- start:397 stop:561 length:165 start_codon:yes stop_codon:yes gene_type:complete
MKTGNYIVEYWINTPDGYDNMYVEVQASKEEEALHIAKTKKESARGKDFKIYIN